ncbi:Methyltransferase-like protein 22 [Borealophlyctis nickersoniae]|nr:Methyltransferase-like protein 22 [Borealophlyctis nickersoniae]
MTEPVAGTGFELQSSHQSPDSPPQSPPPDLFASAIHKCSDTSSTSQSLTATTWTAHSPHTSTSTPFLTLTIHHHLATPLPTVGLQLWSGALILSDFILTHRDTLFRGATVCELGAGTGMVSVLCGRSEVGCRKVFATDVGGVGVLELARMNVERNGVEGVVEVREVDLVDDTCPVFCGLGDEEEDGDTSPADSSLNRDPSSPPFSWPATSLADFHTSCTLLLASDIIYDSPLTFAFTRRLPSLLLPLRRTLYLSLERRIVFSIEDRDAVAPAMDYFLNTLEAVNVDREERQVPTVRYEKVDLDNVEKWFEYERTKEMELWRFWMDGV